MSVVQQPRRSWVGSIWRWLVNLLVPVVTIWSAVLVLPDFTMDGTRNEQLLALAIIAVVYLAATNLLLLPIAWGTHRAVAREVREMGREPDWGVSDREFFAPFRRAALFTGAGTAGGLAVTLVAAPIALWLAARLCAAIGLPVRLSGFWPIVIAAAVVAALGALLGDLLRLPLGRRRMLRTLGFVAEYALPTLGLWLVVVLLGDARQESGPGERQLLVLVIIAALFAATQIELSAPFLTIALQVVVNALKLWLLSWASGWTILPVRISGFWTFVLAALIVTAVTWPERWIRALRAGPPPPPTPVYDPFMDPMTHHFPTGPYY